MSFKPRTYGSAPNVTILPHFLPICHYLCWLPLFGLKLSWRLSAELTLTITRHIHGTFYTWYKSNIVFPNAMNWRCWVVLPFIYLRTVKSDSSLFLIICFQHLAGVFRTSYSGMEGITFLIFSWQIHKICKMVSKYSAFWKHFSF